MDACTGATSDLDIVIQSFLDSIGENATDAPFNVNNKRRRVIKQEEPEHQEVSVHEAIPGWVPKPSNSSPVVSWTEGDNVYTVQNPNNTGGILLRMELYNGVDRVYSCGLFIDKKGDIHKRTQDLIEKIENLWIDKTTGVPKTEGLTQTVMQRVVVPQQQQQQQQQQKKPQQKPTKRRVVSKKKKNSL